MCAGSVGVRGLGEGKGGKAACVWCGVVCVCCICVVVEVLLLNPYVYDGSCSTTTATASGWLLDMGDGRGKQRVFCVLCVSYTLSCYALVCISVIMQTKLL